MKPKNSLLQAVVIIVAGLVCAVVANGFAGRTRQLKLPGYYPDATRVPPRKAEVVPPPAVTAPAETVAPVPAITETAPSNTTTIIPLPPVAQDTRGTTAEERPVKPNAAIEKPAPKPSRAFNPHPDTAYLEISGDDVEYLHKQGALFLDARRSSVFEQGHIAGARPFSVWESDIDDKVAALFNERQDPAEQNLPIVIYCSGGDCEDSHMLSQKLWGAQFNNVYVYKDGFPDWQKRGGAVRTGSAP